MRCIARCFSSLIAAGFCLSALACAPAGHMDSTKKVATATSARGLGPSATRSPQVQSSHAPANSSSRAAVTSEPFLSPAPPFLAPGKVPAFIDCAGSPLTKPREISLSCTDKNDRVVDINWSSWSASEAIGTGIREKKNEQTARTPVTVVLRKPLQSGEAIVFADVYIDGRMILL
ncbi:Hypothetical protein CpMEX30_0767 [Corynebacterium pseudotuberculosis]|uniref:Secreted protein n=1 Tax=Corynebacterium pseudotuberculosis 258 TaxID=1168865 RepID=A0AAU8PL28_CORPS|nr:hypothetical protein [Corynebacterium pseudotuberculosis]AEQ06278.2 hypothetical protein CPCIP5297_03775 [Corynebacterium pseudotuberculosis CIP 52.97]AER68784.1 Hypothetical protein Cp106_0704 [Corynebacterium pseudotuberculosis 1/06-A]AFB72058.1 hypothetical protein CP316_03755 [Corynebacterium pseudotuberculosis 316]AFK16362.1 hypothetical protein CP258_03770 [Corynebacterium pseudotuberculosis 258]QGW57186.1 hypothetical protein CP31_03985 [Corynebacterium pseudotuberculosis 31]